MPKTIQFRNYGRWLFSCLLICSWQFAQAQVSVTLQGTDPLCFGLASGAVVSSVTGGEAPYTYSWSNGETTPFIENLTAGTYGLTVTDANMVQGIGSITLSEPPQVTLDLSADQQCEEPFVLTADGDGGVPPYTYNWSTGANTSSITVPAGNYCVTIVDANLCGTFDCIEVIPNPPTVGVTAADVNCFGGEDGSLTAFPAGGTPPYTYLWSNGGTTQTITDLPAGTYGVTITDDLGCTASASGTVAEPPLLTVSVTEDGPVCEGIFDRTVTAFPAGGTPPYTYLWSNGATTQAIAGLGAGTYSVTITDQNNCTVVGSATVDQAPSPDVIIEGDDVICGDGNSTDLTAVPSGGTPGYQLLWSTGSIMPTITVTMAGTYVVTVTDAAGCMDVASFDVSLVDLSVTTSTTDVTCNGFNDGTATVFGSGGTQPYTYMWSTGATTQTITGLAPGTYSFTITEVDNCKASGMVTITEPDPLQLSGQIVNPDCVGDANGSIDLSVTGGTPAYSYLWSTGATTEDISGLSAGNYAVTVTDQNGCTASATFTLVDPDPINLSVETTDVDCFGDDNGTIDLTVSGGTAPYTYDWSDDGQEDPDDDPEDRTDLIAATYQVTVTDANGCTAITQATIGQPDQLILSTEVFDVLCFGQSTGSVDLTVSGGTPPYFFNWSNGFLGEDLSNVPAGTYTVEVLDANDCAAMTTVTIEQPTQIVVTGVVDNVDCFEGNDGSVDITVSGGTPGYTYLWSTGATTEDIFGLVAGNYAVTITDANNCTTSATFTVVQPNGLVLTTLVTDIACAGDATGAIDLTVGGGTMPYTYDWSNDGADDPDDDPQDISNLAAGTYSVTVTDANGCTAITQATVEEINPISLSATVQNLDCFGDSDGSIDLTVLGGSAPFTFEWSTGALTEDISGLVAGTYTVTVTDVNECTAEASYNITQPAELMLNISAPTIVCGGTNSGSIVSFPSGGTEPYSYLWSTGATTTSINDLSAGIYGLTITDANGCTATDNAIQLSELPELTCTVQIDQQPTMGDNGSVTAVPQGGTAPFTYVWSTGATTQTITNLSAGTYTVTITDANNCTTVCSATLQAFSGIGDFVWEDFNADGQQDPNEPGIADYPVYLKDENGNIIDSTITDADGFYAFLGLTPGTYSILFPEPPGGIRTLFNAGDDATDSDGDPAMDGMTQNYTLAPGEFNMTVDAGFFAEPNGAIVDPCLCLNNNTTNLDGQFSEIVEVVANIGQTWTIIAQNNMFLMSSPAPPAAPIPVPLGTTLTEVPIPGEPTLAKYVLEFLLVDSFPYDVVISNGVFDLSLENQCFYPEINFVEEPPQEVCRFDLPILLEGFGIINGEPLPGNTVITINGDTMNVIDPMALPLGEIIITATFFPDPPLDDDGLEFCMPSIIRAVLIVNDCPAKVGDFVWNDLDFDGIQDPGEPGIPDVMVIISSEDGTFTDTMFTDANGMYMFMVDPGTYKVTFEQPSGLAVSPQDAGGDDALDSDVNPNTLMTGFFTVGPNEQNLTIDAGFFDECIANVDDPGTIGFDQELCGAGNVPDLLVELTPATGGVGEINYLWMKNTADPNQPINFWTPIPDSNTPNLQLGPVYESTYYARCVRRNNCVFLESNTVFIEVGDDAVAIIDGPEVVCELETATFSPVGADGADNIQWSFTGPATVMDNGDGSVDVSWGSFGIFSATLSVTDNGCTATRNMRVVVINNPATCDNGFTANGGVDNLVAREININWLLPMDGSLVTFTVERSIDGQNFSAVGLVTEPYELVNGDMGYYRFNDIAPLAGTNFYRVWAADTLGNAVVSNIVELTLNSATSQMAMVYPNPAIGGSIHVQMLAAVQPSSTTTIELYNSTGVLISSQQIPADDVSADLPINTQPSGVYLLRIVNGDQVETHQVMVE